jgi:hypothetical protein
MLAARIVMVAAALNFVLLVSALATNVFLVYF